MTQQHGFSHMIEDLAGPPCVHCTCGESFTGEYIWQAFGGFNSHIRKIIETTVPGNGEGFRDADGQIRTHESYCAELQRVYDLVTRWSSRARIAEADNADMKKQIAAMQSNSGKSRIGPRMKCKITVDDAILQEGLIGRRIRNGEGN